jgi:hypothetical protein
MLKQKSYFCFLGALGVLCGSIFILLFQTTNQPQRPQKHINHRAHRDASHYTERMQLVVNLQTNPFQSIGEFLHVKVNQ